MDTSIPVLQGKDIKYDWVEYYQGVEEEIPVDMPTTKGISEVLTTYVDANHASVRNKELCF